MKRRAFVTKLISSAFLIGVGNRVTAVGATFEPQAPARYRFAVASDGHYGQPDTTFDEFHDEMINWLNADHQRKPLDFTMFNGDLIHDDPSLLSRVKAKFDQLNMPYYTSHGNHDRIEESVWKNTWTTDFNYSFTKDDLAFLILDTADIKGNYICPNVQWVKKELKKHRDASGIFIFMHISSAKWTENGLNCSRLTNLFSKTKNVKAIFHGHDHDLDALKVNKGKPHFFDSHIGGSWGTDYRGYRIVEILDDGNILTYQINPASHVTVNENNLARLQT